MFWIHTDLPSGSGSAIESCGSNIPQSRSLFLFTVCRVKRKISKGEGEPASGLALKLQTGSSSSINYADPKQFTYWYVLQVCVSLLAFSSLDGA